MSADLTIVHLFPDELGINGDRGNVMTVKMRAEWRGLSVSLIDYRPGEPVPESADFVHIGSGPLSSLRAVYNDLPRIGDQLREWVKDGVPLLAIAGGWQLLGEELVLPDGERLSGAGVFPSNVRLTRNRIVGEALVTSPWGTLAGFENHSSTTSLEPGTEPLGMVVRGGGNSPGSAGDGQLREGVRVGMSIGTHLHGSVLPLNPVLADAFLAESLARRQGGFEISETPETKLADGYAVNARRAIASRLGVKLSEGFDAQLR